MHEEKIVIPPINLELDDADFLQGLLNTVGLAIIILDPAGRICLFNRACELLTGYAAEEVLGQGIFDLLIPPQEADGVRAVLDNLVAGAFPNEHENGWLTKSGNLRCLHWYNTILAGKNGRNSYVVSVGIDITDSRQTEKELHRSAQQIRLLTDHSPALIAYLDPELHFLSASESYRQWFKLSREEIIGRHIQEIVGNDAFSVLGPKFKQALAGETVTFDCEVPYLHGGTRFIHATYIPNQTEEGELVGLFLMAIDLTEQYRLASALSATNRRNQAILDTAVDGIITINDRGIIESFNRSAERMFGFRATEMIGQNVSKLMPSPHAERHDDYIRHYLTTGERRIIGIGREVQARRKDGTVFPIELAVGEFVENGRHFFTGFTRDISDRKRMEQEARDRLEQLAHVARQNSLGVMTSGLAHEINQPLTAIVTTAQACLRMLRNDRATTEILQKSLAQIVRQGERASSIINEMRQFLRKSDTDSREPHDINELIPNVLNLLSHDISMLSIDVRQNLDARIPRVPINRIQIEQILLNLIRNAIEALSEKDGSRVLEIETGLYGSKNALIFIDIADNGPGFPDEIREHLFEPFVTTKPNGLGQGLIISRSIAHMHGGDVQLVSDKRRTCFRVTLPVGTQIDQ